MSTSTQSLTSWAMSRFSALYDSPAEFQAEATTTNTSSFESHIRSMFSKDAQIFVNHDGPMNAQDFQKHLGQTFGANKTEVEWKECFETEDAENSTQGEPKNGIVAGYLIVTRTLKFRIRATPAKNYTHISLSAKIAHDEQSTEADKRRITQMFFTSVTKAAPVHIQGAVRH
ncbi:hypothetical protein D9757_001277 [Collybiopsis confluens]|uniref:Uncharacterized protein n=1 Tax=Collybiopsis confluens TaxID=2823264 RepID=A0A8H5I0E6_9AGAR|nr:hypothetical protein D9757_001277 [Collybiopsis confluens]